MLKKMNRETRNILTEINQIKAMTSQTQKKEIRTVVIVLIPQRIQTEVQIIVTEDWTENVTMINAEIETVHMAKIEIETVHIVRTETEIDLMARTEIETVHIVRTETEIDLIVRTEIETVPMARIEIENAPMGIETEIDLMPRIETGIEIDLTARIEIEVEIVPMARIELETAPIVKTETDLLAKGGVEETGNIMEVTDKMIDIVTAGEVLVIESTKVMTVVVMEAVG